MINIQQTNYKPQKLQKAEHKKINIFVRFFYSFSFLHYIYFAVFKLTPDFIHLFFAWHKHQMNERTRAALKKNIEPILFQR